MDSLINLGTAFHSLGAANRKARSLRVALGLTFGQLSRVLSLELLKLYLDTGLGVIKNLKYEGAKPLKILKAINGILNSILNFTGSQCKSTNKGVMLFHCILI